METDSGRLGHRLSMGQERSPPARTAGMFRIVANLNGHGQTWNLAVEFHPNHELLRIAFRNQSPQPPKTIARAVCEIGRIPRNWFPWAMEVRPSPLDTRKGAVDHHVLQMTAVGSRAASRFQCTSHSRKSVVSQHSLRLIVSIAVVLADPPL